jgi:TonB family protein
MRAPIPTSLVFVFLLALIPTLPAQPPTADLARYMFRVLEAAVEECPEELSGEHDGKQVLCAAYASRFGVFKLDWESATRRYDFPDDVKSISHWTLGGGRYSRVYEAGGASVTFIYDGANNRLLAIYDRSDDFDNDAPEADTPDTEPLREPGFGGVSLPQLIPESKVEPIYPSEAGARELSGIVTLSLIIGEDGYVREATLLRAEPEGVGFEEAALEAVKQWRYRPSMLEGEAVEVRYTINVPFVWTVP